ncbi:MAG TPA: hypothetical protein V6D34_10980, partial [Candidatus Sericytochromatia bacterium]
MENFLSKLKNLSTRSNGTRALQRADNAADRSPKPPLEAVQEVDRPASIVRRIKRWRLGKLHRQP